MRRIVLGALLMLTGALFAQQDPMYTMYMYDKVLINPAYTGSSNWAVGTLKYREQFLGFEGHPTTETLNFHSPIQKYHIGLGFKVINDQTAVLNNINATAFYSYHLNFASGKLSVGIEAGIYSRRIDFSRLILENPSDNTLPLTAKSSAVPDASVGLYYQKKQFYIGFSNSHFIKKKFDYGTAERNHAHLYNHMYLIVGKVFDLSDDWTLEPGSLLKYQSAAPLQADVNLSLMFRDRIALGVQYRTEDAVAALLKIHILEGLRIAYSYDLTISGLSGYSRGAHEIIISYGVKIPPPPAEKEVHPRYYF